MINGIGAKIKDLRLSRNTKSTELADFLEVSRSTLARWEKQLTIPSLYYIYQIAEFFKIDITYFFADTSLISRIESLEKNVTNLENQLTQTNYALSNLQKK